MDDQRPGQFANRRQLFFTHQRPRGDRLADLPSELPIDRLAARGFDAHFHGAVPTVLDVVVQLEERGQAKNRKKMIYGYWSRYELNEIDALTISI